MVLVIRAVAAAAVLLAASVAFSQPTITSVSDPEPPRSGLLLIEGFGFGTQGEVFIAGLPSWTSTWTGSRVVAYVPEAAPVGPADLQVVVQGQESNTVPLTLQARTPEGRIRWKFQTDGDNQWWRPALAPDGTLFLHTSNEFGEGIVYALTRDGALKWIQKVWSYPYVPPSAGPEGEVYVATGSHIYRISPQGRIDWELHQPDSTGVRVSPTVGPDGLLYGAFDAGAGAFAVNRHTGDPVWSNTGSPPMTDKAGQAVEGRFGPSGPGLPVDQFYVSMDGGAGFYAFSLSGQQLFTSSLGNITGTAEPAIGADGTIYGPRFLGLWVGALDPLDGTPLWDHRTLGATGTNNVEIGPDGILYYTSSGFALEALNPGRQKLKWSVTSLDVLQRPALTPDGRFVILGGSYGTGGRGFVRSYATKRGREQWTVDLPYEPSPGYRVLGVHHPRISSDSTTAYVSTSRLAEWPHSSVHHTWLFALDITSKGPGGGKGGKGGKGGGKGKR